MNRHMPFCVVLAFLPTILLGQAMDTSTKAARPQPSRPLALKQPEADYPVRTFALHRLTTTNASELLSPYVPYPAHMFNGANEHEITVRGPASVLARVDSVLREEDKPARTVVLRFQLIIASDSAFRDPATTEIDAALRDLFRFKGYRLLAQGTVLASEYQPFELTLGSAQAQYMISGRPAGAEGSKASLPLYVGLHRLGGGQSSNAVLSTGVTVPLGQTVVLGSAARDLEEGALILTVKPELQSKP